MIKNKLHINFLADKIYKMDKVCRFDFTKNHIVSERDYISIFLNFIRYPFGPFSTYSFAHSQTLSGSLEQKYGADGIIIFKKDNDYKIGVFEAKVIKKRWDSLTGKKPKVSRFQNQINKQGLLNSGIAVWEMFLNRNNFKVQFDQLGSTCVKRQTALSYSKKTTLWTYADLEKLAENSYISNGNVAINIEQIIKEILSCDFGDIFQYDSDGIRLYEEKGNIRIPLIGNDFNKLDSVRIQKFLEESNFYSYTHIDLNEHTRIERSIRISELLDNS